MITGAPANILDYGAVGDGATDSTSAIQAAINAASASTFRQVCVPAGNYLISSTITIPSGVTLVGQGNHSYQANGGPAYQSSLTKNSSMTTAGIKFTGDRGAISNLAVLSQSGATGDGIWIAANGCSLINVASNGHGANGVRIGSTPSGYVNCNSWYMQQVSACYNTAHGVIIDDQSSTYPASDVNAGTYINGELNHNGDSGLFVGNCFANTFIGILTEINTNYGVYFNNYSAKCTFIGGDQDEANTVGVIYNNGTYNTFLGIESSTLTSIGTYTTVLGYTTNTLNTTNVNGQISASTGSVSGAPVLARLKNQSANASGAGTTFQLDVPAGVSTPSVAGALMAATQNGLGSNYVTLTHSALINGTMTPLTNTLSQGFQPGADNTYALGYSGYRWSVVYAATGTINTSDANQKQQFAALTTAEQNTAKAIKGLIKTFKFNDAVAKKGAEARLHVGVSAQEVQAAFTANGLDANKYGLFCSDTWHTLNGEVVPAGTAGATEVTQLGVRYEELLAFVIGAM